MWSGTISEIILQSVNTIKRNEEAGSSLCPHFHDEVFNTSKQKLYFLSVQPKSSCLLTFLVIFDVADISFSALTPCYVFLDCSDCSVPISSRQFILELSPGCVDRSWQSNNILEQNLSVKCENTLWYGNWLISFHRVYIDFCFTQESNDFRIFEFSHSLHEIQGFTFFILWNSMKILSYS